ncbi:MAG: PAS domain S-box protein [Ignavibacteriales bacterium]|nr:PAS domain S-box protein [Ignavibacteriales bacterium]MBP9119802.1 PAS domain S-box protein [Ignavibacterium sp.]
MEKKKIFVVEDESIVSLEIQSRLKSLGYAISGAAASGDEAIRKVIDLKPDLILMDIRIKGDMDGIETAAEIKKIYDIPIIFLTAYADPVTIQRAKITDPFGYIIKPFEERELHISIEIALYKDHSQKLLREKDKWLSTILRSVGDAVIATDTTGKIKFINNVAERLTGYTKEEATDKELSSVFKIRSEATKEYAKNAVQKVMQTGEVVGLANHSELVSKNGIVYPIADSGSPIKDENGNITGVVVVFQDLSYYKKTEELINIQTTALNSAYSGIVITDFAGEIIYVNDAMYGLTGYTRDELMHKNVSIFKSNLHPDEFFAKMWQTISSGQTWKGEIQNRKKNGDPYYEEMSVTPLKNEHNDIVNFISVKEDISDRKKIEIELRKAKDEAERSDRLKSEFLAQMSHEIRTPISIISNFMQIYEDELREKLSLELKSSISAVKTESLRIISTIDSIVNMAQLKAGTFKLRLQKLNLYEDVLKPTLDQWVLFAKAKKLDLFFSGELENIFIEGDAYSLSQAINHIIDNAIKYTDKGNVQVNCKVETENVIITVSDTGNGITKDYLPYIFDPFTQEHQGYNRKYEGNGLGMALVKQYCILNNASLIIDSEKWVGTTVKVFLPKLKKGTK